MCAGSWPTSGCDLASTTASRSRFYLIFSSLSFGGNIRLCCNMLWQGQTEGDKGADCAADQRQPSS